MQLSNKTALVTGASSGIGASFAQLLASKGTNLILVARSIDKLNQMAKTLSEQHGVQVHCIKKDLSEAGSAEALYEEVKALKLEVDLLINNAGFGKWGKFESFGIEEYQQMVQLNITSLTDLCYCFLPDLKEKPEAGIINVGSTASFMPIPYSAVYGATKSYVLSFTEALVGEFEDTNIKVCCLCPGGTSSNFSTVANAHNKGEKEADNLMSSGEVARLGLEAFLAGKHYVITGRKTQIRILKFLSRKKVIEMIAAFWRKRLHLS